MSRQYYYLVAGLPDIFFDDKKLSVSTVEFRAYLNEYLTEKDMELIRLHFWQFDHENILSRLNKIENAPNPLGNLTPEMLDELFSAVKDGSYETLSFTLPAYIIEFIEAFKNDKAIIAGKSWDLQFTELYYNYLLAYKNTFIAEWYNFEQNLRNILTAYNCRNNDITIENQLIGVGDLQTKLIKSSARDFGIDNDELESADIVFKALETRDLLEQEKKIDMLRWDLLSQNSFFHYFSIEKLFVFLIKLSIAERWISLDKTKGLELFKELLSSLETSYEFPAEFSLK
jgi:hypothetical protein